VLAWVQETQPKAWETLSKNHGSQAGDTLLTRLRDQLDQRGTLDVLRHGIELLGLKAPLLLAQFKPALALNADILSRYAANRLRVVRQLRYSLYNENCIDLVLFLNGLPVATVELKTDFTQSINDAIDQYRFDRNPKPKGQAAEPLLSFPNGALVHFAVNNSEVQMVTKLAGADTVFLPFNQGNEGAAGNPPNPQGHRTAYLWEQVWARERWLEILEHYLIAQRDKKKQIEKVLFPRFHQLDLTHKLQAAVLQEGPGGKYLVQHSAGSGKTNSIAWTAHFLAELHDGQLQKLFDTVLVVSDRNVIDAQLQEALFDFQRTSGVVATITNKDGSKSGKLAFKLAHEDQELDDRELERSAALKRIMGWVKLHSYNIAQKIEIVVEHFRRHVAPLLNGQAKAMVVVGSRLEAVRWQLAIEQYIKQHGYSIGTLVAFSAR